MSNETNNDVFRCNLSQTHDTIKKISNSIVEIKYTYRVSTETACRTIMFLPPICPHANIMNDVTEYPVKCSVQCLINTRI